MQRTSSILNRILHHKLHCCLHKLLLIKIANIPFAITISLGVFVSFRWCSRYPLDFFFFNEPKLNFHRLLFVLTSSSFVATFLFLVEVLILNDVIILVVRFAFIATLFSRHKLFRIHVKRLNGSTSIVGSKLVSLQFVVHLLKIRF
jgi:hypothetical protein